MSILESWLLDLELSWLQKVQSLRLQAADLQTFSRLIFTLSMKELKQSISANEVYNKIQLAKGHMTQSYFDEEVKEAKRLASNWDLEPVRKRVLNEEECGAAQVSQHPYMRLTFEFLQQHIKKTTEYKKRLEAELRDLQGKTLKKVA